MNVSSIFIFVKLSAIVLLIKARAIHLSVFILLSLCKEPSCSAQETSSLYIVQLLDGFENKVQTISAVMISSTKMFYCAFSFDRSC